MKFVYSIRTLAVTTLCVWATLTATFALADEAEEKLVIPDTPAAIWQSIDEQVEAMDGLLASGELEEVHHHAIAVRDLALALPAHSQDLKPGAAALIKANSGYVKTIASRLDETGDANDKAGTKENLEKLKGILARIRSYYPDAKSANDKGK